jgi:hypothetical protein
VSITSFKELATITPIINKSKFLFLTAL